MNELICEEEDLGSYVVLAHLITPIDEESSRCKNDIAWKLQFDGAQSRIDAYVNVFLMPFQRISIIFSSSLEFFHTNIIEKYETIFLVLELAINMGIKILMPLPIQT